ncbi:MAG TPA: sigma-70 family RNA polymerase sigma factor [Gemmataceae bacterium]|nr:sigma-70 family RNA polymerase sigma factor [Gemmataceae bacterium]
MQSGTQTYQKQAAKTRRDQLILAHLPLVKHAIGRLVGRLPSGVDAENLESAGVLGLVEAANRYDPERGVKFETYAYPRIRGAVVDEMRRNSCLSQQALEHVASVRRAYQHLPAPVTVEALAAATGLSEDQITDCLASMRLARTVSLDKLGKVANHEPADDRDQPGRRAEQSELRQLLAQAIAGLPERTRMIVTLYYLENLRLKEIGELIGLSESRVSRLLDAGLFALGEQMRSKGA